MRKVEYKVYRNGHVEMISSFAQALETGCIVETVLVEVDLRTDSYKKSCKSQAEKVAEIFGIGR